MRDVVDAWRIEHGDCCPGWEHEPHTSSDLTADHATPVGNGGAGGPLFVLCRECNARRGDLPLEGVG